MKHLQPSLPLAGIAKNGDKTRVVKKRATDENLLSEIQTDTVADTTAIADLPHYAELSTLITGSATDAVASGALAAGVGTPAAVGVAPVAGIAAVAGGIPTWAWVAGGAGLIGGGAAIAGSGGSTPATPDTTPPATIATTGFHFSDIGRSTSDGLSSNPTITLDLASDTARWQYSLDNGTTWIDGSGNTITLTEGTYDKQDVQVKQFDAAGNSSISHMSTTATLPSYAMVQLEGLNQTSVYNDYPQITAVGTSGEYVVTFQGIDSTGRYSVFVQKFASDGSASGVMVQLEAINNTTGYDYSPQITAVGTSGEYVVTFYGVDSAGDYSIFVQKFNSDGTVAGSMVQLEAINNTTGYDYYPQITAVGTSGEYVVTFFGRDATTGDYSIYVQKFAADGTVSGSMVQLEAIGVTNNTDRNPQISAVGTNGAYVVTFYGIDSAGDYSIFVQKFNSDGTVAGSMVQLEAIGVTNNTDLYSQITAVGTSGEYVVTFQGIDSTGRWSIFTQKFAADGSASGSMVQLAGFANGYTYTPQVTAIGTSGQYVVVFEGDDNNENNSSVFVQKFNADGSVAGDIVELDAATGINSSNYAAQVTAIGNAGEYVVTFVGDDSNGNRAIFVQKFNADGSASGEMVQLEGLNQLYFNNESPQITAIGSEGEFAVTFMGYDSNGGRSVFVQKFNANGSVADTSNLMQIDTTAPTATISMSASALKIGDIATVTITFSEAVYGFSNSDLSVANGTLSNVTSSDGGITWTATYVPAGNIESTTNLITLASTYTDIAGNAGGVASSDNYTIDTHAPATIAVTGFHFTDTGSSDGVTSNGAITLDLASETVSWNYSLDGGATWTAGSGNGFTLGDGTYNAKNIMIQQIDAVGNSSISSMSTMVQLQAIGMTTGDDRNPQITAVGTNGEYVVTFQGIDSTGHWSIFVQKFAADGNPSGAMVQLDGLNQSYVDNANPQVTAVGTSGEYVVTFEGYDSTGNYYSVFVQKFAADGTVSGSMVQLEGIGVTTGEERTPQITAIGSAGAYVVTFYGVDSAGDYSIFVQKFNSDGTVAGSMVQLEAIGVTNNTDQYPQITAVGTSGEYVVTFQGIDSTGRWSIFTQKFAADGSASGAMVQLDGLNQSSVYNENVQISAVGTSGEYVVSFQGYDSTGNFSVFVQKFAVDGTVSGAMVQLEAIGVTNNTDQSAQITAVGTNGEYVVTFQGRGSSNEDSIFVQKFNSDGTVAGAMVQLEAINNTMGWDSSPQVTAVGTSGEYVVTFFGQNSNGYYSIFTQKFASDGTASGAMVQLEGLNQLYVYNEAPQITSVGTSGAYVVTFNGTDSVGNYSVFVQKFNADGTIDNGGLPTSITVDTTAPVFDSSAAVTVYDPITTSDIVYDAQTTEGDTGMHYTMSGVDAALFNLDAATGEVTFVAAPSVSSPADSGADSVYDFTITATDLAGYTTDQAVALSVTHDFAGSTVTSNGVTFTLGAESIQNGKSYYHITSINGAQYTSHNVIDAAFNGGADTVDTVVTAGVDDARTFIVDGVTYVLPTATELLALSSNTPEGWMTNGYFLSSTLDGANTHIDVYATEHTTLSRYDGLGDYVVLQVIPA